STPGITTRTLARKAKPFLVGCFAMRVLPLYLYDSSRGIVSSVALTFPWLNSAHVRKHRRRARLQPHCPGKFLKSTDATTAHVENPNVRALQPSNDELHRRQTPRTSRCLCWPFSSQMVWKSCAKTGRTRCNAVAHKELRLPSHPVFQLNRVNVLFRQQSQLPNNLLE